MYEKFYGFEESPFNITPDPRFLFFSEKHREAFNHLLFGIRERKGFIQITGEVGAGKTTLCRALLEELGDGYRTALILNPVMTATSCCGWSCASSAWILAPTTASCGWRGSTSFCSTRWRTATTWCCSSTRPRT